MHLRRVLITLGQLILAIIVTIFILYKLALVFDWVPPDFSPMGVVRAELKSFQDQLQDASYDNDLQGKLSKIAFVIIVKIETYFDNAAANDAMQDKLAKQCEENSLMRFFMFMGGKSVESSNCIKQNLQVENALKEIDKPGKTQAGVPSITPATNPGNTPVSSPKVTIINSAPSVHKNTYTDTTTKNPGTNMNTNSISSPKSGTRGAPGATSSESSAPTTLHGSQLTPTNTVSPTTTVPQY